MEHAKPAKCSPDHLHHALHVRRFKYAKLKNRFVWGMFGTKIVHRRTWNCVYVPSREGLWMSDGSQLIAIHSNLGSTGISEGWYHEDTASTGFRKCCGTGLAPTRICFCPPSVAVKMKFLPHLGCYTCTVALERSPPGQHPSVALVVMILSEKQKNGLHWGLRLFFLSPDVLHLYPSLTAKTRGFDMSACHHLNGWPLFNGKNSFSR